MIERSTVNCTNCAGSFIAELDLSLNGNHEITCPLCQHVHYRVVRDGVVTEDRWRSSAGPIYIVMTSTTITIGGTGFSFTNSGTTTTDYYTSGSWLNRSDLNLA